MTHCHLVVMDFFLGLIALSFVGWWLWRAYGAYWKVLFEERIPWMSERDVPHTHDWKLTLIWRDEDTVEQVQMCQTCREIKRDHA